MYLTVKECSTYDNGRVSTSERQVNASEEVRSSRPLVQELAVDHIDPRPIAAVDHHTVVIENSCGYLQSDPSTRQRVLRKLSATPRVVERRTLIVMVAGAVGPTGEGRVDDGGV